MAGTGKSTIARTLAAKYSGTDSIAASFFFSRSGGDGGHLRHATRFVTSIAVQLANNIQPLKRIICNAITKHGDIANRAFREQWNHLIHGPLSNLAGASCASRYILVIDALDECEDEKSIGIILQLLAEAHLLETVQLRVFITSRPEVPIRNGFTRIPDTEHQDFRLHEISSSILGHDIRIFLRHELKLIAREHYLGDCWPTEQKVDRLVYSANGLFIWAATACRFINEGRSYAEDRLSIILKDDSADGFSSDDSVTDDSHEDPVMAPEQHLDKLYITVLRNAVYKYQNPERKRWRKLLGTTMATIVVLSSPLSIRSLTKLLNIAQDQMNQILNYLHAILEIPKDSIHPLRLHHPSFRDFLLNQKRCKDLNFEIDEKQAHQTLATKCIQLMSTYFKPRIGIMGRPSALVSQVNGNQVKQHLPPEVQYACLYWIQHLQRSGTQLEDDDQVHRFLQEHFLHWLETLGWIGKVSEGVHAIISLESFISVSISLVR